VLGGEERGNRRVKYLESTVITVGFTERKNEFVRKNGVRVKSFFFCENEDLVLGKERQFLMREFFLFFVGEIKEGWGENCVLCF